MDNNVKNIIFDWSGVVKDAIESHLWIVNKIFKELGLKEISREELQKNWEQPHMLFYNKYLPNLTETEEEILYKKAILSNDCPKSKPIVGICELIKKLKQRGYFLGVISSDLSETILPEIKDYGLENIFDEVVFLSTDKVASLKIMMEKFKLSPKETCFIGDSNHEIIAGKATGVKTIAVTWGINTEEYLKSKNPDFVVNRVKELEEILLK
jgi:HAD superfamily hydrolase (TIGR01509 family)